METKYCKECEEYKPISEFHKSQKSLLCKYHHNLFGRESKKKYRLEPKNKEKEKLKYQERKIRLWSNFLLHNSKTRDCENTLTVNDIEEIYKKQKGLCYWFNVPLIPTLTKKHPQQPSLDRIDRYKGYTRDNVVLCCYAANIGRNETDVETWKNFIDVLLNKTNITEEKIKTEFSKLEKKLKDIDDRDEYVIYDENLNETVVRNLNEYCRNNNISFNTLRSSRKKIKRNTQKGLIILNRTKGEQLEKRIYTVKSPDGDEYTLSSLRDFCIKNNLNDSALHRVGKGELKQFKGWKCEYKTILLQ
jgi:hypothetical protein